jgi:RimJ/RimL family protein N-acetyltransferase
MEEDRKTVPGPAYRVHTPRLVLRCWKPRDAPLLKTAIDASLEHLREWMPWAEDEPQDLQAKISLMRRFRGRFDLGQDFVYGIFNRDESAVVGGTGLHTRVGEEAFEIGYWIHVDHINRGFATEAAGALTRVAFEVNDARRVEIHCDPENERSAAVARKLGFVHEATLRRRARTPEGELRDTMIWTLLAEEYPDSVASDVEIEAFDGMGRRIM